MAEGVNARAGVVGGAEFGGGARVASLLGGRDGLGLSENPRLPVAAGVVSGLAHCAVTRLTAVTADFCVTLVTRVVTLVCVTGVVTSAVINTVSSRHGTG